MNNQANISKQIIYVFHLKGAALWSAKYSLFSFKDLSEELGYIKVS